MDIKSIVIHINTSGTVKKEYSQNLAFSSTNSLSALSPFVAAERVRGEGGQGAG